MKNRAFSAKRRNNCQIQSIKFKTIISLFYTVLVIGILNLFEICDLEFIIYFC